MVTIAKNVHVSISVMVIKMQQRLSKYHRQQVGREDKHPAGQ